MELIPYEVYGGTHALQKWIDHKPVEMYAVPKTDQDIENFEKLHTLHVIDESFFMLKHCWQVGGQSYQGSVFEYRYCRCLELPSIGDLRTSVASNLCLICAVA